jgi:hypothetical protein
LVSKERAPAGPAPSKTAKALPADNMTLIRTISASSQTRASSKIVLMRFPRERESGNRLDREYRIPGHHCARNGEKSGLR